jgi:glycerophosphoryl diester phosphodiesterase
MSLFKNKLIAHRGLHEKRVIPENSLLAFKKALEKGYSIEFDINITKDNQIVVFHDDDLKRLCGKKEKIEELEFSFLNELKLYETEEKIPLFDDLLNLIKGKIPLIIEIKKHQNIGLLENILIDKLKHYPNNYLFCSFEKEILIWFKNNQTNKKRGLIFESFPKKLKKYQSALFLYRYFKTKPDFVSLEDKLINSSIYSFCKKRNLEVVVWTIKNEKSFKKIENRVSAIIFENFII